MDAIDWSRVAGSRWYRPEHGPVDVREGIVERVRAAAETLRRVAQDPSGGGHHRPAVKELLENLDDGWADSDA